MWKVIVSVLTLSGGAVTHADVISDCPGSVYGKGKKAICLPLGDLSFADQLVRFTPGERPADPAFSDGQAALGTPNYKNTRSPDFVSLGCDGELVLQFADNVLVDVEGMDLHVFEVGPFVEATALFISQDGSNWLPIGEIEGSRSDVDIAPFIQPGERYNYVMLRNSGKSCGGKHGGADIDAVAAVGAEIRLSLNSAVLFDVGQASLKPEAKAELDALASKLAGYGANARFTVEGHTDSTGSDADNLKLSQARAQSVADYLAGKLKQPITQWKIRGYGEARPVASNDEEEGRARNRRVDLLVAPGRSK